MRIKVSEIWGNKTSTLKSYWFQVRRFFYRLNRAWSYARFSWNNEDWDYVYLLECFIFKLKRIDAISDDAEKYRKLVIKLTQEFIYVDSCECPNCDNCISKPYVHNSKMNYNEKRLKVVLKIISKKLTRWWN